MKIAELSEDRAFIAPSDPTLNANLYLASNAWMIMAEVLSNGRPVSEALKAANTWLSKSSDPLRYSVYPEEAGDVTVP